MKKNIFLSLLITLMVGFTACNNVDEPKPEPTDGQVKTLYSEDFGTAAPTATPFPLAADYTGYKKAGDGAASVTYTALGTVSIRGNAISKDYTGATGGSNAMAASAGASLIVNDIATCGAKKLTLAFGSNVVNDTLAVSYKINGTANWVAIPYTKTTSTWGLVEKLAFELPAGTNTIKLKFTAGKTQYGTRIDDISLTTTDALSAAVVDPDTGGTGGVDPKGSGTEAAPYNVTAAIANQNVFAWVEGYIVGNVDGTGMSLSTESKFDAPYAVKSNMLIAATANETDYTKCIPVQLPTGAIRDGLNLVDHATNDGKKVKLYGSLEAYFGAPGLKNVSYYELEGGTTGGSKPTDTTGAFLNETLLTQASFDKFTAVSVTGDQVWAFDARYGAVVSGFAASASHANEDWFISPAMDLTGKTNVKLTFDHARGPAGSITVGVSEGWYTVWVSNGYTSGAPTTATWTEITGVVHGTTAWGFVSSGSLTIPTANLKANARIAFKYLCTDAASATWEVKNIVVK